MRIGQVTYSYKPVLGGADVYAAQLHRVFSEAGHESIVFQAPHRDALGPEVRPIPLTWLSRSPRARFWTAPSGLRRLRDELARCDVLIAHYANYHLPIGWHPRVVLLSHGVWWDDRPRAIRSCLKRALTRRAYRRAAAVVANDTFFFREMGVAAPPGWGAHQEIEPRRWFVPNAVDTDRFSPADPRRGDGVPVVLVPRNLYRNRGVHLAIEAAAVLRSEVEFKMRVVGGIGQADYAAECEALVVSRGLQATVEFAGPVPWEDMPGEYRAATATLVPSVCGEGTSLAALESMACGTPCVATSVAGLRDLPARPCAPTADSMAGALLGVLREPDRWGPAQREAVVLGFALPRWTATWLRVVEVVGG